MLSPVTRSLLLFVPLASLAANWALPVLSGQHARPMTSLSYTGAWLRGIAHEDSWAPMRLGSSWLARERSLAVEGSGQPEPETDEETELNKQDRLLYQEVFFERGVKLQYPPTSLLVMDALEALPGAEGSWTSNARLNGLSWLAVVLTIVLSALILDRQARAPPARQSLADRSVRLLLALVAGAAFYPLVFGFYLGQVQTWLDGLVAGLVLAMVAGRPLVSGALAGLACLIKPQLGLLLLWGLLRRQNYFVAAWLVVTCLGVAVSLALYGLGNHLDYLEVLSYLGRHGESFNHNQSLNGLLHRLLGNGNNLAWENAFPPFHPVVYGATLVSSLGLIGGALLWRRGDASRAPGIDLGIAITSITLASPIAWSHHYGVLLPLFALALPEALRLTVRRRLLVGLLAVSYLLIANTYRALNQLAETPVNFLQSYVFFGGLLFLFVLYGVRRYGVRRCEPNRLRGIAENDA